jgi:NAD(P)-dependent dehydrogenase (short-subunit alcohol dehydrogenase family)
MAARAITAIGMAKSCGAGWGSAVRQAGAAHAAVPANADPHADDRLMVKPIAQRPRMGHRTVCYPSRSMAFSDEELATVLRVLRALAEDRSLLSTLGDEQRRSLLEVAGRVSRPSRHEQRRLNKALRRRDRQLVRTHDARLVAATLNREARRASDHVLPASTVTAERAQPIVASEPSPELLQPRSCYVCKSDFRRLHHFYDSLCPDCADLNYRKRFQTARLDGRVALVTGARIKIGYQASLILLRAGAQVVATTRFVADAAERYAREPDFAEFAPRLTLHALDLAHTPSVERFAAELEATLPRLDLLINNAALTVRRPPQFYRHLMEKQLPAHVQRLLPGLVKPIPDSSSLTIAEDPMFPRGAYDLDQQQLDLRPVNSWRLTLGEVPTVELLEVHLVNAIAPCILASRLKPLMLRQPTGDRHIVNVSAMEAQFARNKKTDKHPHTNMAKAALNMMTRTSAVDYARGGIFMNSVDTGWVTDEDPLHHVARKQDEHDFHPPLDAIDGAARVLDPIFTGLHTGDHPWGHFFKDYKSVPW